MEGALKDRVAVVTGAASGMGRAGAIRFAREGARVAAADVNAAGLEETARTIREADGEVLTLETDLRSVAAIRDLVDAVAERLGGIDVVYNNAGVIKGARVEDYTEEDWDNLQAVNGKAQFFLIQRALPYLRKSPAPAIVNCSSMSGLLGMDGQSAYCASKGSSVALTRALAFDLAPDGIRVNCICPGAVDTAMPRSFLANFPEDEQPGLMQGWFARQLLKRFGRDDEIASVALFLASEESSFLTGVCLPVDGGWAAW